MPIILAPGKLKQGDCASKSYIITPHHNQKRAYTIQFQFYLYLKKIICRSKILFRWEFTNGSILGGAKDKIYAYIAITCNNHKDIVNGKLRSCQEELTYTLCAGHPAGT